MTPAYALFGPIAVGQWQYTGADLNLGARDRERTEPLALPGGDAVGVVVSNISRVVQDPDRPLSRPGGGQPVAVHPPCPEPPVPLSASLVCSQYYLMLLGYTHKLVWLYHIHITYYVCL